MAIILMEDGELPEKGDIMEFPIAERKFFDLQDNNEGTTEIKEGTELGDSLRELNNDTIEHSTRMSGIDMRSRLFNSEISSLLAVDTLVAFRLLPISALGFSRQKKRLAVSRDGKGRTEIVDIVGGKRDQDARVGKSGILDRMRNFMQGG